MVFIHSFTWFSGPHSESEGSRRPAADVLPRRNPPRPSVRRGALQLLEQHTENGSSEPSPPLHCAVCAAAVPVPSKYYNDVLLESYSQLVLHSLLLLQRQPRRHHHGSSNVSVFEKKSTKIVICLSFSEDIYLFFLEKVTIYLFWYKYCCRNECN